ncbi:cell envelope integrity protein TolA [Polaromonas sp. JS666]|uniref:cell envelope integrity protein TolA n=1 Tax=Polaromonas sp. (strain JS666 / ATCC BAA-500) TaxID=296591 RepID=UPI00088645A6|nr:cell envelope integrity protein TolA [Polaromonas sp. JS666]SDM77310.1 Cell division and transport-associated protein TolA [Polaromonas sp. JS666]
MPSAADRIEFGPPRDTGSLRAFGLAVLAHLLLMAALTWGINWKHSDKAASFEAEIWTSVPQAVAPKLVEAPTPPPPPPAPPTPEVKPPPPPTPNVDIALEQEKKRKLLQQQKEAENQKQEKLKAELQAKKDKELKEQKAREELAKRKAAEDAKKLDTKEAEKKKLADAEAEKQRQANIRRAMGLAGATGSPDATGTAQRASGPSANYRGRLAALFKRNIVFANPESIQGNPKAVVQVKVSSTGLIMSSRLSKSSGVQAWDDAVLRAVEKAERIPPDENGKIITDFPVEFGPKD